MALFLSYVDHHPELAFPAIFLPMIRSDPPCGSPLRLTLSDSDSDSDPI